MSSTGCPPSAGPASHRARPRRGPSRPRGRSRSRNRRSCGASRLSSEYTAGRRQPLDVRSALPATGGSHATAGYPGALRRAYAQEEKSASHVCFPSGPISSVRGDEIDAGPPGRPSRPVLLEVPSLLAVLHRGLRDLVVGARCATLGDAGSRCLEHDLLWRARLPPRTARAGTTADRTVA